MTQLLQHVTIASGGVVPKIAPELIPRKKGARIQSLIAAASPASPEAAPKAAAKPKKPITIINRKVPPKKAVTMAARGGKGKAPSGKPVVGKKTASAKASTSNTTPTKVNHIYCLT